MRACALFLAFLIFISTNAWAESIDGRLASIDRETRYITLGGGEVMVLAEPVPMDDLTIGQLLRLEYEPGTVDVSAVLVLEEPPPPPPVEEPIFAEE